MKKQKQRNHNQSQQQTQEQSVDSSVLGLIIAALNENNKSSQKVGDALDRINNTLVKNQEEEILTEDGDKRTLKSRSVNPNAPETIKALRKSELELTESDIKKHDIDEEEYNRIFVEPFRKLGKAASDLKKSFESLIGVDHVARQKEQDIANFNKQKELAFNVPTEKEIKAKKEAEALEYTPVLKKKGFTAAMRRGMLDIHGDVPIEGFSPRERIGRATGKAMAFLGGVSQNERRAYARKHLYGELELQRATGELPREAFGYEEYQLEKYEKGLKRGDESTGGVTVPERMKTAREDLINQHDLDALEGRAQGLHLEKVEELKTKLGYSKKEDKPQQEQEQETTTATTQPKQNRDEFVRSKLTNINDVRSLFTGGFDQELGLLPQTEGNLSEKMSAFIDSQQNFIEEMKVNGLMLSEKFNKLELDEFAVKSMLIGNLQVQQSDGLYSGGDSGASFPSFDLSRARTSGKAGKAAKFAKGVALPALAAVAGAYAIDAGAGMLGVGKDESGQDIKLNKEQDEANWQKMSLSEKLQSGMARGIESVGSFIGLDNLSTEAAQSRIKSETEYFNKKSITPSKAEVISAAPDTKAKELSSVKAENEMLRDAEKQSTSQNNVIVNAPTTNIAATGGKQNNVPSNTRPSYTAFERFVDRTFTAV